MHLGIQLFKSNSLLEGFEQVIKNTLRLTDKYVFFAFKNHFYLLIMYPHSTYLGCDKVSQKIFHLLSESKKIKISSSFSMLEGNELRQVINGILSGIDLVFNLEGNHITHYSCEDRKGNAFFS